MLTVLLVVVLVLLLAGSAPLWPYSSGWVWGPGGIVLVLLVVLVALVLTGRV